MVSVLVQSGASVPFPHAGVAKLADALDSKSSEAYPSCGFESHLRHQSSPDGSDERVAGRLAPPGRSAYASRTAFIEISAFISFEIGQPALASFAALSNPARSAPGTFAETSR